MTITIVLAVLALLVLFGLVWRIQSRASVAEVLENPAEHLRTVDVDAFRNLIDPAEEDFLRTRLPADGFRRIQRERLWAAMEYVQGAADNAAVLIRLAEVARRGPDAAGAEAAEKLIASAIQLRWYAFQALARLYVGLIFPGGCAVSAGVAERYESLRRQVVMLGLQHPAPEVSAAL